MILHVKSTNFSFFFQHIQGANLTKEELSRTRGLLVAVRATGNCSDWPLIISVLNHSVILAIWLSLRCATTSWILVEPSWYNNNRKQYTIHLQWKSSCSFKRILCCALVTNILLHHSVMIAITVKGITFLVHTSRGNELSILNLSDRYTCWAKQSQSLWSYIHQSWKRWSWR